MARVPDYYQILAVEPNAPSRDIRKAFRARVLEVHPDKAAEPTDGEALRDLIQAFEVLGDPEMREDYDRILRIQKIGSGEEKSKLPHVTESERPINQARSVLYLLLRERGQEALERLRTFEESPRLFLRRHLDEEEFIDAAFLLGEVYEKRGALVAALRWYQEVIEQEADRRMHRPCLGETVDRVKRLLIYRLASHEDPRVVLQYLRRAEALGLSRVEKADVLKRRAQCFLDLDMKDVAAQNLREALHLNPQAKGTQRLREALSHYWDR